MRYKTLEFIPYWKNKYKIYKDRRDKYKKGTLKYSKYDWLMAKATYKIALIRFKSLNKKV